MVWILFDVGGTNIRVAAARGDELGDVHTIPTPRNGKEGVATLATMAREMAGEGFSAAAGGLSGSFKDGAIYDARNLREWEGMRFEEEASHALGVRVRAVNDAAAAGLGEAHYGAGKGFARIAYINVGTGVGGACIVDGRIDPGSADLKVSWIPVADTNLEDLVSGTAIRNRFGIEPRNLDSLQERTILADQLANGLATVVKQWTPECIVLGGAMILGKNPIPIERVHETLEQKVVKVPEVRKSLLGEHAVLQGAVMLAAELA